MWQASASVMVGPGLATDFALIDEVKAAIKHAGLAIDEIEEVDPVNPGLYLIPLTPEQEAELQEKGSIDIHLELPEEARPKDIPKPEFATHVWFHLEMP